MGPRHIMLAFAAALLSAVTTTLLLTLVTLVRIEEAWNIVVVSETLALARVTFVVCLAPALVLGLPGILLLHAKDRLGIASCALAGFFVGAVPFGLLALTSMFGVRSASTGGTPTVVNGVPTLAGWIEYVRNVGSIGLFGLAGGLTAWAVTQIAGLRTGRSSQSQSTDLRIRSWSIVSVAVILTGAILVLPIAVRDNSCHNLFRDGRTFIVPQISANIKLRAEDWTTLREMFVRFGSTHALSFRSDQNMQRGTLMWRSVSLCSEAGVTIHARDQPWLARINSPLAARGVDLSVYELKPGSEWDTFARDLLAKIDMAWPQSITFRGRSGQIISREEALKGRR
jgi:hypothetical protein